MKLLAAVLVIGAAIVLMTIVSQSNKSSDGSERPVSVAAQNASTASASNPSVSDDHASDSPPANRPPAYAIGEEFSIGYWFYEVNGTSSTKAIPGIGNRAEQADAVFFLVDVTARNEDRSPSILPPFKLLDGQGREYEMSPKGRYMENIFGIPMALDFFAKLNPGVSKRGYAVFDVPGDRQYMLAVSGGYSSGKAALVDLSAPAPKPEPASMANGKDVRAKTNPKDGLRYVWIPPGSFTMGCSEGDFECLDNERPPHMERITTGFWLGQTPVTQAAYQRVTNENPSHFKGDQLPVEMVSWNEAENYCRSIGGRLPIESEWEYAARAGSVEARYGNLSAIAWYYNGDPKSTTSPVALKQPNAFGLYDMLGNVWEWTEDTYSGTSNKVARGCSWNDDPRCVRASNRGVFSPEKRDYGMGFRCVGPEVSQ